MKLAPLNTVATTRAYELSGNCGLPMRRFRPLTCRVLVEIVRDRDNLPRERKTRETLRGRDSYCGVRVSRAAIAEPRDLGRGGSPARGGCGDQEGGLVACKREPHACPAASTSRVGRDDAGVPAPDARRPQRRPGSTASSAFASAQPSRLRALTHDNQRYVNFGFAESPRQAKPHPRELNSFLLFKPSRAVHACRLQVVQRSGAGTPRSSPVRPWGAAGPCQAADSDVFAHGAIPLVEPSRQFGRISSVAAQILRLVVVVGFLALSATAAGAPSPDPTASLAYAKCLRAHGVPHPLPDAKGNFSLTPAEEQRLQIVPRKPGGPVRERLLLRLQGAAASGL